MNKEICVYVNGATWLELQAWTERFEQFFGGATTVRGRGTWEGDTEAVHIVCHLYDERDPDFKGYELDQLLREYKREAKQDAVLTVVRDVQVSLID